MSFLLDTNIFITAKNELPMDVYPSFWRALAQLATQGVFKSIKKVEDEIRRGVIKVAYRYYIRSSRPLMQKARQDTRRLYCYGCKVL